MLPGSKGTSSRDIANDYCSSFVEELTVGKSVGRESKLLLLCRHTRRWKIVGHSRLSSRRLRKEIAGQEEAAEEGG